VIGAALDRSATPPMCTAKVRAIMALRLLTHHAWVDVKP
jgi:hypothetical protein